MKKISILTCLLGLLSLLGLSNVSLAYPPITIENKTNINGFLTVNYAVCFSNYRHLKPQTTSKPINRADCLITSMTVQPDRYINPKWPKKISYTSSGTAYGSFILHKVGGKYKLEHK